MTKQTVSPQSVQAAITILREGGLVALPTETVYGLAADATNSNAVAKIFAAKNRPSFNPLIAHFAATESVREHVDLSAEILALCDHLWPGPLTLVAPFRATSPISAIARNGASTLAVRVPSVEPGINDMLRAFPNGLVAPSANPSRKLSPTTAQHVADGLGASVDLILDAGPCSVGLESTILDVTSPIPRILRHGGVSEEELTRIIGQLGGEDLTPERVQAPGQLHSHYQPRKPVWLDFDDVEALESGVGWLGFGDVSGCTINLSASGSTQQAASNLFDALAQMDARDTINEIFVSPIPNSGLGRAINDRLARASYGNGGKFTVRPTKTARANVPRV